MGVFGSSATIYYTLARVGYLVVATVQSEAHDGPKVIRFTATLGPGQATEISAPRGAGQAASVVRVFRDGDRLEIESPAS